MKKILMIIAQNNFRDEECFETKKALEVDGLEVVIAAPKKDLAIGSNGGQIMPSLSFDEIKVDDFEGVIFVGGQGSKEFVKNEFIESLLKEFAQQKKLLSAICYAPAIFAAAGILDNKKATSHLSAKHLLQANPKIQYLNENVVVDDNVITADGPESSYDFGEAIVKYFNKEKDL